MGYEIVTKLYIDNSENQIKSVEPVINKDPISTDYYIGNYDDLKV